MRVVADIGGTNTRLALAAPGVGLCAQKSFQNADYASFEAVLAAYLAQAPRQSDLTECVIAMAGPVHGAQGRLTNLDWEIDAAVLGARFAIPKLRLINDLTALGLAAFDLAPAQLEVIHARPAPRLAQKQALVVGIGTGFNVSPVMEDAAGRRLSLAVEAGHFSLFAALAARLEQIEPGLSLAFATTEALFSGRGRRKFLSLVTKREVARATPFLLATGTPENAPFDAALDLYAELIGMLLAELKVAYLPSDGIYLAGGIARSSLLGARAGICRTAAEAENAAIKIAPSLALIIDDAAALTGAAALSFS